MLGKDLSNILWRIVDEFEARGDRAKGSIAPGTGRSSRRLTIALICALVPVFFIGGEIKKLIAPDQDIYNSPEFYNLTKENVMWDVFYGKSESCGKVDCHLTPDYAPEKFTKRMVLPAREFPLVGYKDGEMIYARTTVLLPERILSAKVPVVFHSLYVWAEHYEFYVNGVMLDEGKAETLNITIPNQLIPATGVLNLAFKIDPGKLPYQGVAHRKDLLIGAKDLLKRTSWRSVELTTTYWLWFLIPKLTFCFIFAVLYIFVAQNLELYSFILYIFLSSLALVINSAYADNIKRFLGDIAVASPLILCVSDFFLLLFFHDFFRRGGKLFQHAFRGLIALCAVFLMLSLSLFTGKNAVNAVLAMELFLRGSATVYGVFCSFLTGLSLKRSAKSRPRMQVSFALCLVLCASLMPVAMESIRVVGDILNMNIGGFPYLQAFDLVLFASLALITASEFGNTASVKQRVEGELRLTNERLALASSVQNLLLPASKTGTTNGANYEFFFEPAQTMAGDWFYIWDVSPAERRLFIGDVTGKGPQAALAVSVVISTLAGCRDEGLSVEDAVIKLNRRVFGLFGGKVLTVMNVTVIRDGRFIDGYNFGSFGWVVRQKTNFVWPRWRALKLGFMRIFKSGGSALRWRPGTCCLRLRQ